RLKLLEEEVSVLQCRLGIDATQEISDPQRGWIRDLFGSVIERGLPDISRLNGCKENLTGLSALDGPTKKVSGFRFLCRCPQVVPFRTKQISGEVGAGRDLSFDVRSY
ncbi:MAG TPA: hypothetical protein VNB49_00615, partial [Candidatus Dormibacteraeota bacterium]|nr:hypothetical protein [Candidatus Dormibacteraeota bacterium]